MPGRLPARARRQAARGRDRADAGPATFFDERRRVKTAAELAGIRRAQAAAEAGMAAARDLLRQARCDGADGARSSTAQPLTVRALKAAIAPAFVAARCDAATTSSSRTARSRRSATTWAKAQLRAGETIVIDLWPRDNESACYADMTRTFVVGEVPDEVAEWHRALQAGARAALVAVAARASAAKRCTTAACDLFEGAGYPTQRTKADGEILEERLLPLARPRRRARGARAADPRHASATSSSSPATSSRSSRASTVPASAACGSRISSSSRRGRLREADRLPLRPGGLIPRFPIVGRSRVALAQGSGSPLPGRAATSPGRGRFRRVLRDAALLLLSPRRGRTPARTRRVPARRPGRSRRRSGRRSTSRPCRG